MNKFLFALLFFTLFSCSNTNLFQFNKGDFVKLETTAGDIIVELYDETPLHKQNFVKLVKDGYYDGVIFHRVINDFMIQSGDPKSKNPQPEERYGGGGPDYKIPAEINSNYIHKKGALAAARDNNPEKKSSGSQFYIVEGEPRLEGFISMIEDKNNITYTEEQKDIYKNLGGVPFLDNEYTVFGEVVQGMSIVEKISDVETDRLDRPKKDIFIKSAKVVRFKKNK